MSFDGELRVVAELDLRPQDRFANPKGYALAPDYDVFYCSFKVNAPKASGIYWILVNDVVVYIGRAKNLHNRLSVQYGTVSPRHPYKDGQLQKCRTNAKINSILSNGGQVSFRWKACVDYFEQEHALLKSPETRPAWNLRA
ncbi:endonuclease II [Ruegeria denitrificans]|uniref:Endonuclease II n=1 Tax=Ruegeria denitrificans TaxID=1715692 RepID=A0A0N7M8K6_9RHOB|nr:hypothetical protein [Ruegeria denitrificans]CUJ88563.1 endonuclease II [Ruegeria denitrificans]